jgi:hypothetical protein
LLLEILSVHIISFEDFCKKKQKQKNQPFATPSPPYLLPFRFHLLPAAFVSRLALSFNFALLFECANPWLECSLPRTPHISITSKFCFSRQSLLQSFASSTGWLQVAPVCVVRTDKNLITALVWVPLWAVLPLCWHPFLFRVCTNHGRRWRQEIAAGHSGWDWWPCHRHQDVPRAGRFHSYDDQRAVWPAWSRADIHQDDARCHRVTTWCIEHGCHWFGGPRMCGWWWVGGCWPPRQSPPCTTPPRW